MRGGYDGEIRIDSSISTSNFNKGLKGITAGLGAIGAAIKGLLFKAVVALGFAALFVGNALRSVIGSLKTMTRYAKHVDEMREAFNGLKAALGAAFAPLITIALPYIQAAIAWLTKLFNIIAMVIGALTGQKTVMQATAGAAGDAADSTGKMAKNTKEAEKAAKGALASFDEISVLEQPQAAEAPGGGGGAAGGAGSLLEEVAISQSILDKMAAIKGMIKPVWDLLAAGVNLVKAGLEALKPLGVWLWENFLQPLARWTGGVILRAIEWLTERLNALSDWIKEHPTAFQNIAIFIGIMAAALLIAATATGVWAAIAGIAAGVTAAFGAAVAFLTSPVTLVILAIAALIAIIILLIKNWDWVEETALRVWDEIVKKWNTLSGNFRRNIAEPIKKTFSDMWTNVRTWARTTWTNIVTAWQGASTWFRTKVTDPVKAWFKTAWEDIQTFPDKAWTFIKGIWEDAGQWFKDTVTGPIKNAFDTALEDIRIRWETTWDGIKGFIKNTVNGIISLVNGMISAVSTGINAVIGHLNAIKVTVPDWVPGLGGKSWGLNIPTVGTPQVPYLAQGAVIPPNAQFLAMLGDQRSGVNIETPEKLLRQIVREELADFAGGDFTVEMPVYLDSRKIYEGQQRVQRQKGGSLIKEGATI